jgi:two-component system alkaline phosphatase synthesis response regulator PhoP
MSDTVLIVDDEPVLLEGLEELFQAKGYEVSTARSGEEAELAISTHDFDAVVLDVMLPDKSGFEVLAAARARGVLTPILVLTARDTDPDKVEGFRRGADDYVTKPFSTAVLVARVEALIRRSRRIAVSDRIRASGVVIDLARHESVVAGVKHDLTSREVSIVRYLFEHRDRTVSRQELLLEVWGYPRADIETRTVENHIAKLRQKIEVNPPDPVLVRTVRGEGYRFGGTLE